MGRKSRERQEHYEAKRRLQMNPSVNSAPMLKRKKGFSNASKMLIGIALIAIIVVGISISLSGGTQQTSQQSQTQSYPKNAAPVYISTATLSSDGNKVTMPASTVNSSKLVFVDLKLKTPTDTLPFQGRNVPLAYYKNGQYLPLVIISTPSGNTVAGIRTCEPCGSFSFHIVKGANLKCDVCGAEWTLENFTPVSGGCATYPPPKLPVTVSDDSVTVDLSALNLQYAA